MIHETAIIDSNAKIGKNVEIGPFCIIGPNVKIGDNNKLQSNVVLTGNTTVDEGNVFYPFYNSFSFCVWLVTGCIGPILKSLYFI